MRIDFQYEGTQKRVWTERFLTGSKKEGSGLESLLMLFGVALKVYSFVNIFLKTMSSRVTPGALDFLSYTPDPSVLTSIGVLVKGFTDVGRYV